MLDNNLSKISFKNLNIYLKDKIIFSMICIFFYPVIKGLFTNYVSQKLEGPDQRNVYQPSFWKKTGINSFGSRPPLPPLSAIVSISPTPPPPFVRSCQHFPNPPSPLCQLSQHLPNPPSLFRISFVNIFNDPLILNNLYFIERQYIIWLNLLIFPDQMDKNPYFFAFFMHFQWFQH